MSDTAEILEQAARWREAGSGVALATVVTTWGSSPRPVGANLVIDGEGNFFGELSPCPGEIQIAFFDSRLCAERELLGFKGLFDTFPSSVFQSGVRRLQHDSPPV